MPTPRCVAAADIEEKREARKARVNALRAKRNAAENAEQPKAPSTFHRSSSLAATCRIHPLLSGACVLQPKAEPKPGVRLSSKEVFEIIAQRKAPSSPYWSTPRILSGLLIQRSITSYLWTTQDSLWRSIGQGGGQGESAGAEGKSDQGGASADEAQGSD